MRALEPPRGARPPERGDALLAEEDRGAKIQAQVDVDAVGRAGPGRHRGRQGVDFQARVGVYQGQPMVTVRDGRESDENEAVRKKLSAGLMREGATQELELRVVPSGADDARQMILQVYFNNALVHSQQLKLLTRSTNTALKTIVFTSGNKRAPTDVAFDNYRLERRKEVR